MHPLMKRVHGDVLELPGNECCLFCLPAFLLCHCAEINHSAGPLKYTLKNVQSAKVKELSYIIV